MALFLSVPSEHRDDCPRGWEAFGDSCFHFASEDAAVSWLEAADACQALRPDSHLASCLTPQEAAFIRRSYGGDKSARPWLGYSDW